AAGNWTSSAVFSLEESLLLCPWARRRLKRDVKKEGGGREDRSWRDTRALGCADAHTWSAICIRFESVNIARRLHEGVDAVRGDELWRLHHRASALVQQRLLRRLVPELSGTFELVGLRHAQVQRVAPRNPGTRREG